MKRTRPSVPAASRPNPRRPSRLGLVLTFCLLIGLFLWRFAMPRSPLWLDLAVLAGVAVLLLVVKLVLRRIGTRDRKNAPRG